MSYRDSDARLSNSPLDFREFFPYFHPAEVRAFCTDRRGHPGSNVTRRTEIAPERRKHGANLLHFFHRSLVNLFLCVEASAHRPFMQEMQQRSGLDQAHVKMKRHRQYRCGGRFKAAVSEHVVLQRSRKATRLLAISANGKTPGSRPARGREFA